MKIDPIINGIVIDHISAGKGLEIYEKLGLDKLDCSVAIIKNISSRLLKKKDIIKIDADINVNLELLGYIDQNATVNYIKDSKVILKKRLNLPERVCGVIKCKNPRCITSSEPSLENVFVLTDKQRKIYRCIYCEAQAPKNENGI